MRTELAWQNPLALIIVQKDGYKALTNSLSRKLAGGGCTVEASRTIPPIGADYIIYLGYPPKASRGQLQKRARQFIAVVEAEQLNGAQKQALKPIPVFFLPRNYNQQCDKIAASILEILFTQPPAQTPPPAQTAKHQQETTRQAVVKPPRQTFPDRRGGGFRLVEKRLHFNRRLLTKLVLLSLPLIAGGALLLYPYLLFNRLRANLQSSLRALQTAEFTAANLHANQARQELARLQTAYFLLNPLLVRIAQREAAGARLLLTTTQTAIATIHTSAAIGLRGKHFLFKLFGHEAIALQQESAFFRQKTTLLQEQLRLLLSELAELHNDNSYLSRRAQATTAGYRLKLTRAANLLAKSNSVVALLPEIFAANGKKKYLLLFQNNMELRPTGGFIGSVGFLRFENGKMLDLVVEDVYNLDGQLEGHVEPPYPIKKYLGELNWFLRDANWDPDFPRSAQQIAWFLQKEIHTPVDGIIAVDLDFAKLLLAALGGVALPDYNEFITADNLYLKTQTLSTKGFFPGSTGKRDFLGSLSRSLLINITTRNKLPTIKLLAAVNTALTEKHILLNFADTQVQQAIDNLGWSGRLLQPECKEGNCFPDYLMVVEANLGVNKVNYFVQQKIHLKIAFDNNRLRRNLRLDITNNSSSAGFPGGTYKDYLRILVPPNATLETGKVSPGTVGIYQSFATLIEVPPGKTRTLEIAYSTPIALAEKDTYELLLQKQPGTNNPPLTLQIKAAPGSKLAGINFSPTGLANKGGLLYNTTLSTDKIFKLKIL